MKYFALIVTSLWLIAIDLHLSKIEKLDAEISDSLAVISATLGGDSGN